MLAGLGVVVALLPAAVHSGLWPLWPAYLTAFALALGNDALHTPRRRDLTAAAIVPDILYLGRGGQTANLILHLPSRRPVTVEIVADVAGCLAPQPALFVRLGETSRNGGSFDVPLVPTRRGRATVERLWLRWQGPLGLMSSMTRVKVNRKLVVAADLQPVRSLAVRLADPGVFRTGLRIERGSYGGGLELDSLREHVPGDDSRHIDWKASAHHRKLVIRQGRAERGQQVLIAVDSGHLMNEPLAGMPKLDHAVQAALLLTYLSLRSGDRVGWVAFDSRVRNWIEPQAGVRAFQLFGRMASRIAYSDEATDFSLGLTELSQRLGRRSRIVVLTDFLDALGAERMIESLSRLSRRHVVVFVALHDPRIAEIAGIADTAVLSDDHVALSRAAVAGALLRDRGLVLRRLARLGVRAVDAAPAQVAPWLIDTCLDRKSRWAA